MKSFIAAFCSLILLASVEFSQSPAEADLLEKLIEDPDRAKALETVRVLAAMRRRIWFPIFTASP